MKKSRYSLQKTNNDAELSAMEERFGFASSELENKLKEEKIKKSPIINHWRLLIAVAKRLNELIAEEQKA
jgi:hypothetical protein